MTSFQRPSFFVYTSVLTLPFEHAAAVDDEAGLADEHGGVAVGADGISW
ncbi:hypothetical protein [Pseudofrankia sp. BMG5.37]|nr:hypothetical protein [Pseudofrankia sp. BMG5.37]MDT3439407.1 hypothetical protein [Pseudofrankia sp. BMG5.37]